MLVRRWRVRELVYIRRTSSATHDLTSGDSGGDSGHCTHLVAPCVHYDNGATSAVVWAQTGSGEQRGPFWTRQGKIEAQVCLWLG